MVMISAIGTIIYAYSIDYMYQEPHERRFTEKRRARGGLERPVLAEQLEALVAPLVVDEARGLEQARDAWVAA